MKNIRFKVFNHLVSSAKKIREAVFIKEQGFNDEFDESDNRSIHIIMYLSSKAIGVARIIYSSEHKTYQIGRFAILKEYRLKGYGRALIKRCEEEIINRYGHIEIGVSAQKRAIDFYKKVDYISTGITYLDENYPHEWMIKKL